MLGCTLRCKVTGFEGIAVARVQYINGCVQYCVKPKMNDDGKMPSGEYIDIGQLEVIGDAIELNANDVGGDMSDTPKENYS